ncbi:RNA-guided endonuclease TnpB family protein [Micromonospora sp. BRA006-A]|nr:RNA-guided endonuclease TnpB family protein [Micromonospora sp. BRA006-A]
MINSPRRCRGRFQGCARNGTPLSGRSPHGGRSAPKKRSTRVSTHSPEHEELDPFPQRAPGRPTRRFPRFKSRRRTAPSVRFTTGTIRVELDRKHIVLPRLGRLKLHESARKLARRIDSGTARIMSATVRRDGGRWHVAFTCEVERTDRRPTQPLSVVGVDLGIKHLAVLSTGEKAPNPQHLIGAQARLRRFSRALARKAGPDRCASRHPSGRWERASARLSRAHARVRNLRRDGLHKLTTRLAREHGTIVLEDLNVAGMLRNRRLARHIADAGFAELRRQLAYKAEWYGGQMILADRWYPPRKPARVAVRRKPSWP